MDSLELGRGARGSGVRDLVVQQAFFDGVSNTSSKESAERQKVNSRGKEIGIVFASDLASKVLRGKVELVALGRLGGEVVGNLLQQLERVRLVDALAFGGGDAVASPLP